jgi:hypothetical protein
VPAGIPDGYSQVYDQYGVVVEFQYVRSEGIDVDKNGNVIVKVKVTPQEVSEGFVKCVAPFGKMLRLEVKNLIVKANRVTSYTLKGRGVPTKPGADPGDMIFDFFVTDQIPSPKP